MARKAHHSANGGTRQLDPTENPQTDRAATGYAATVLTVEAAADFWKLQDFRAA
ncbi:MAG TPA: hypothetical protein VF463_17185 [Sphingobium sp.]